MLKCYLFLAIKSILTSLLYGLICTVGIKYTFKILSQSWSWAHALWMFKCLLPNPIIGNIYHNIQMRILCFWITRLIINEKRAVLFWHFLRSQAHHVWDIASGDPFNPFSFLFLNLIPLFLCVFGAHFMLLLFLYTSNYCFSYVIIPICFLEFQFLSVVYFSNKKWSSLLLFSWHWFQLQ